MGKMDLLGRVLVQYYVPKVVGSFTLSSNMYEHLYHSFIMEIERHQTPHLMSS